MRVGCKVFDKPFHVDEINQWLDQVEKATDPARELANWYTG